MKNIRYIFMFMPLLLQGCDFFYSTVEFKGKEAEPRLCVVSHIEANSSVARVDVLHSEFFLHAGKDSLPVLSDAVVTLQINDAAPVPLSFVEGYDTAYSYTSTGIVRMPYGHYETAAYIHSRDVVRLHVEHPEYGSADAVQVCPDEPYVVLTTDSVSVYGELYAHLHVPAYTGNETDMMTLVVTVNDNSYIYSPYSDFSKYDNYQTASGYYAGKQLDICMSKRARDIPIVLDHFDWYTYYDSEHDIAVLNITVYAYSRTAEEYLYRHTLAMLTDDNSRFVPELSSLRAQTSDDMDFDLSEIIDDISEEFSVLGNAENYQVYGNLTGDNRWHVQPFGCFTVNNWYLDIQQCMVRIVQTPCTNARMEISK